jgi:hypothetical protein
MALAYISGNKTIELDEIILDKKRNSIIAKSSLFEEVAELELILSFPLSKVIDGYKNLSHSEEESYLFLNQYYRQRDIIEFSSKSLSHQGRLGYFYSKNVLFDLDGSFEWTNKFLITAAFRAIVSLMQGNCETNIKQPDISNLENLELENFYPDFDSILVLNLIDVENFIDFDFKLQYSISLRKFGFYLIKDIQQGSSIVNNSYERELFDSLSKRGELKTLNLKPLSNLIVNNQYIQNLFNNLLTEDTIDISRFILLYQVVEILMDIIYRIELRTNIIDKFDEHDSYTIKNKVVEITSEKKRINKLFNEYSFLSPALISYYEPLLDNFLTRFLVVNQEINVPNKFYKVRNGLTHNYRSIYLPGNTLKQEEWNEFVGTTEIVIIEILENLKIADTYTA